MRASPARAWAVAIRHYYLLRGSVARLAPLFLWVAIDMVLWGFLSRYLNAVSGSRLDFVPRLLGAVLLWDFLTRVMQGVTTAFFEDVWSRNFLNLFATPLSVGEYLTGLVISSVATSALGLVVMLALASLAFGLHFLALGAAAIPFLLILFLTGIALGILGAGIVLRYGPAAEWFIWPIPALIAPFAGVYYPLSTLPGWMRAVGRALPPAYVFEGLRGSLGGHGDIPRAMAQGLALALLDLGLAAWFFRRTYRHAIRTGLIARYSAESAA